MRFCSLGGRCGQSIGGVYVCGVRSSCYDFAGEVGRSGMCVGAVDEAAHNKCVFCSFRLCKRIEVLAFRGCVGGCVYGSGCDSARTHWPTYRVMKGGG